MCVCVCVCVRGSNNNQYSKSIVTYVHAYFKIAKKCFQGTPTHIGHQKIG